MFCFGGGARFELLLFLAQLYQILVGHSVAPFPLRSVQKYVQRLTTAKLTTTQRVYIIFKLHVNCARNCRLIENCILIPIDILFAQNKIAVSSF